MSPPRHIQKALDRLHPGVKLEWNPCLHWWVLTANAFWPDGRVVRNAWWRTAGLQRGIEPWDWTSRKPILFIGVIEEGEKSPLSLFQILVTLARWKKDVTERAQSESIDRLEEREENAENLRKRRENAASRDRALDVFNDLKRMTFGRYHVKTDRSHAKAINERYEKETKERYGDMADLADEEVTLRMRRGAGIASVKRERGVAP